MSETVIMIALLVFGASWYLERQQTRLRSGRGGELIRQLELGLLFALGLFAAFLWH